MVLEWYPWEVFSDIKKIGQGGYGTVFRAKPKVRKIEKWDHENNEWRRYQKDHYNSEFVALKTIGDSELLPNDFMQEVKLYLLID